MSGYKKCFCKRAVSGADVLGSLSRALSDIDDEFSRISASQAGTVRFITKVDSGDPASADEGTVCINTADNTLKQYADGAWRQLASW